MPITTTILVLNGISFLAAFMFPAAFNALDQYVSFQAPFLLPHFWTPLTYPLVYLDTTDRGVFNFVMAGFLFYSAGGSLERSWGDVRYGVFLAVCALTSSLGLAMGCSILKVPFDLYGFYLLAAIASVAFATILPDDIVGFFFFPLRRKYFAAIVAIYAWVYIGQQDRLHGAVLGLFGCAGLLAAYVYTRFGRSWDVRGYDTSNPGSRVLKVDFTERKPLKRYPDGSFRRRPYDLVGKWRDAQERKKLDRLLKNSGFSDSEWHEDDRKRQ